MRRAGWKHLVSVARHFSHNRGEQTTTKRERQCARLGKCSKAFERAQCRTKLSHENFWTAMQHAERAERVLGGLFTAYHCEECGGQHVGHVNPGTVLMYGAYTFTREAQ